MITLAYTKIKLILKDKASIAWMIIAPILFITVIVYGFEGTDGKTNITFVDNDNSTYSRELIQMVKDNPEYPVSVMNLEDAKESLVNGTSIAIIIIPDNYSEMLLKNMDTNKIQVVKLRDNNRIIAIKNILTSNYNRQRIKYEIGALALDNVKSVGMPLVDENKFVVDIEEHYVDEMQKELLVIQNNSLVEVDGSYDELTYSALGIMVMFILFFIVNSAGTIMDERNNGIADRIKVTRISGVGIVLGQSLGLLLVGGIQIILLILFGKYLYNINWGTSVSGLFIIFVAYLFSAASLGVLISSLAQNRRQMVSLVAIIVMVTSLLGGCMWSKDMMSDFLVRISYFTPQSWMLDGVTELIFRNGDVSVVYRPAMFMMMFAVIFLFLSYVFNKLSKKSH